MEIPGISENKIQFTANELQQIYDEVMDKPEFVSMFNAKEQVISRYQAIFNPAHLPELSKEEFLSFLKFENNQHWTPLYRQQTIITSDMPALREALLYLVDEDLSIKQRLDKLRPKGKDPWIKGLSKAIITPILLVLCPDKYGVWNGTAEAGMKALNIWPKVKTTAPFSEKYVAINKVLLELSNRTQFDLWTLDGLWWGVRKKEEPDLRPLPSAKTEADPSTPSEDSYPGFGMERYLQQFLFDNWDKVKALQEWDLYEEEDETVGIEYYTEIGRIDLLAKHKSKPKWLVIELKRDQASDETMGQVNRYMGWVKANLANENDQVEGLIIAKNMSEKLRYALLVNSNIRFMEYEIDFHLSPSD